MPATDTILIVDDESAIAALRVDVLPDAGYRVQMALDGSAARAGIARYPSALLLVAIRMPCMSGTMVRAQLREAGLLPNAGGAHDGRTTGHSRAAWGRRQRSAGKTIRPRRGGGVWRQALSSAVQNNKDGLTLPDAMEGM